MCIDGKELVWQVTDVTKWTAFEPVVYSSLLVCFPLHVLPWEKDCFHNLQNYNLKVKRLNIKVILRYNCWFLLSFFIYFIMIIIHFIYYCTLHLLLFFVLLIFSSSNWLQPCLSKELLFFNLQDVMGWLTVPVLVRYCSNVF